MAKKDQESQEKQVLTEWQKRNLEFLRKKETEDSEEFTNGKVVHPEGATSNESQPSVKKKVKKKKRTKKKKRKKGNTSSNIPIAQQNLAGLVIFIAALLIVFSLFFISPWSKQKFLTVSGTKNALPEDVKVASGILDTDYITHVFFNQGKIASTVEKTNVWVKKATVTYSFPNQFNIAVKEYPIVAYRQTTNGYVSILQSGKTGGTVSTSNLPDKFITLKMDDEKKIEDLVKELNKLDTKIKNNIQIINLTPTKATSDLLTIELYDGNSIRVPLSQLTVKLPYYEKIKNQLSDGSIVDMEVGLYTTTPEVESSKTDGDKKKDKDKHKLEIDVYAANVVKDIFRMKLHGKSQDAIACELNSSGILPPAEYKASTGSNYQTCFKTKEKSEWTSVMVRRILTNEVYIGNLVQGKQTTPNHKVKKTIIKEKCEWVRIEKNHEPIITDRDFEVVQRLLAMDTRTSPDREEVYPLSGVVTCGGCGIPMVRKTSKVGGKTYAYYLCATHKDSKQCSSHRISTDKLEEVVLELLQTHIDNMIDLKRILSFIGNVPFQQLDMKKLEERREKKQAEVDRCADLRGMLYEDMKDGIISKEDYKELHTAYEQRKKSAEIAIHQIELEMEDVLNRKSKGFVWLDYFTEHKNIEKLTREVVVSLIREIKVFDKNHIEVVFDFDDCYKECLDVIESQGHFVEVDSTGKLNIRLKEAV